MNISYRWLPCPRAGADRAAAGASRTGSGCSARRWTRSWSSAAGLGDVRIARVEEVQPHPNADRLRLCMVDAGGASRCRWSAARRTWRRDASTPSRRSGPPSPAGSTIRKAKLRGEVSEGMLCSARELGLGRDHAGLMALAGEWEPGAGSCGSSRSTTRGWWSTSPPTAPTSSRTSGVARELAPGGAADVRLEPFGRRRRARARAAATSERAGEVGGVRSPSTTRTGCPRYLAAVVRGVTVGPSPEWLATRLRAVGLRPDQQRGGRHQLRAPRAGPAAARLRPRSASAAPASASARARAGRDAPHPRRGGAHPGRARCW